MKLFITGGKGMLGRTLQRHFQRHELFIADLPDVDITNGRQTDEAVAAFKPDVIIHTAAMTNVDACESDVENAFRVNAFGSANVARAAYRYGARLIAISTDYVFDGNLTRPYHEFDLPSPKTVYGLTKRAGEESIMRHCPDHTIVRIAWLYGQGGPSFLHTMVRLGAEKGDVLKIVADQTGNPTSTDAVADLLAVLLENPVPGIVHGTCEGEASWFDFTHEIFERMGIHREIVPCATADFPRPAPRPANSRLEKRMLRLAGLPPMPHWKDVLDKFIREFPN